MQQQKRRKALCIQTDLFLSFLITQLSSPINGYVWLQVAVIFNPNSELVKSHQTETRFHLNFYPVVEQAWVEQTKIIIDANVSKKEDVFLNEDDGWYMVQKN